MIAAVKIKWQDKFTEDEQDEIENDLYDRMKSCYDDGYTSGEFNGEYNGKNVNGWWDITAGRWTANIWKS